MAATFVYVGNAESNEVIVLAARPAERRPDVVEKVPIPGIEKPGDVDADGGEPRSPRSLRGHARASRRSRPGFAIDPASGTLKHVASGPLADSLAYIATDRTGRFLLGASYPGHKVTVNPIGPPGTVQPAHQVLPDHPNAHSILVDAANRHVLVPTLGNDRVNQFTFDAATGLLAPATPPAVEVKAKAGPRHFVFHPGGTLVYVLGELDGPSTCSTTTPAAGRLTEKQTVSALPPDFQGKPAAADLHITPDGRFLYASRAHVEHAGRLPGRSRQRHAHAHRQRADRDSSRAASTSIHPAATCSRSASSPTRCRATRSIRPAAQLSKLKEYPMGRNPNWIEIVDLP